jgi:hypothetical protein
LCRYAPAMNEDSYDSMKDLMEHGGDYGKEGAAWACCYMAGTPYKARIQLTHSLKPPGCNP